MSGRLVLAAVLAFAASLLITGSAVGIAPVVTITSPGAAAFVKDATPTIEGSASEASEVTVDIWSGSDTSGTPLATQTATPDSAGNWAFDLAILLDDGPYTLIASQTDADLDQGESPPREFTVDTQDPAVAITSPAAAAVVNDATPTIVGSASDASNVTVRIWSGSDTSVVPLATQTATPVSGAWSLDLTALADGPYTLVAGQTDAAGNLGESAPRGFTVDSAPARVVLLTVRPGDHRVLLTWKNPADSDFLRVVVRRGTGIVYQGGGVSLVDRGLFNGTVYTYRFTAVDLAGNISTTTSVRVKPRGRLLSPRDGGVIVGAPVLAWAKVTRATYYNVQLWRNGRKVLSRWPTRPSYELRMRWRYGGRVRALRDGTYLWYVWPGFGDRERGRYGRMLGSATFFKR